MSIYGNREGGDYAKPISFKWYYGYWREATDTWGQIEKAWYLNLITWAASHGDIVGYLPDDQDLLKEIAGFTELSGDITLIQGAGVVIPIEVLNRLKQRRQQKWFKVMSKFQQDKRYPGYIYNRRLREVLQDAYKNFVQQAQAGTASLKKRVLDKLSEEQNLVLETKDLTTGVMTGAVTPVGTVAGNPFNQVSYDENEGSASRQEATVHNNTTINTLHNIGNTELYLDLDLKKDNVNGNTEGEKGEKKSWIHKDYQLKIEHEVKLIALIADLLKPFNVDYNEASVLMKRWFNEFKDYWLELKESDLKYRRIEGKKANWYVTFRHRVESACRWEERKRRKELGISKQQLESASARRARLDRENAERIADLRSRGNGNHSVDPQGLSLDDDGE